jgi:hypothetical protein
MLFKHGGLRGSYLDASMREFAKHVGADVNFERKTIEDVPVLLVTTLENTGLYEQTVFKGKELHEPFRYRQLCDKNDATFRVAGHDVVAYQKECLEKEMKNVYYRAAHAFIINFDHELFLPEQQTVSASVLLEYQEPYLGAITRVVNEKYGDPRNINFLAKLPDHEKGVIRSYYVFVDAEKRFAKLDTWVSLQSIDSTFAKEHKRALDMFMEQYVS